MGRDGDFPLTRHLPHVRGAVKSVRAARLRTKSGRGQPHSKTLARSHGRLYLREVLECGCPLPLSLGPAMVIDIINRIPSNSFVKASKTKSRSASHGTAFFSRSDYEVASAVKDLPQPQLWRGWKTTRRSDSRAEKVQFRRGEKKNYVGRCGFIRVYPGSADSLKFGV